MKTKIERFYREIQFFNLIPNDGFAVSTILEMLENNHVWILPEIIDAASTNRQIIYASMTDGKLDKDGDEAIVGWMESISTMDVDETYSIC